MSNPYKDFLQYEPGYVRIESGKTYKVKNGTIYKENTMGKCKGKKKK